LSEIVRSIAGGDNINTDFKAALISIPLPIRVKNAIILRNYDTNSTATDSVELPSGTDIYDALMGDIEMDLVSVNLPHLDDKYVAKRPRPCGALQALRGTYAKYDKAYDDWMVNFALLVSSYKHQALTSAEADSRKEEESQLKNIESQMI